MLKEFNGMAQLEMQEFLLHQKIFCFIIRYYLPSVTTIKRDVLSYVGSYAAVVMCECCKHEPSCLPHLHYSLEHCLPFECVEFSM